MVYSGTREQLDRIADLRLGAARSLSSAGEKAHRELS